MSSDNVFKRYEMKYLLSKEQYDAVVKAMEGRMELDEYGLSTIISLYFDTPEFLLVRRSMEHPLYKEKLRLRSYGVANDDSKVYVELKKKYDSVVYKRRIGMSKKECDQFIKNKGKISDSSARSKTKKDKQIGKEIEYFLSNYGEIKPAVLLSYDRCAYYSKTDSAFRLTIDQNIKWRDYDLDLGKGVYGENVIPENMYLMELKTTGAIPLWLVEVMGKNKIYKSSFSKYGTAYGKNIACS